MLKNILLKFRKKLKENKGMSITIEAVCVLVLMFMIIAFIIDMFGLLYTEHKMNTFANELVRTAELYGDVGAETTKRQKELEEFLAIKPIVNWNKVGKFNLNESIVLTCEYDYRLKTPLIKKTFKLKKKAIGKSEVYIK